MEAGKLIYLGRFKEAADEVRKTIFALSKDETLRIKFDNDNLEGLEKELQNISQKIKKAILPIETGVRNSHEELIGYLNNIIKGDSNWLPSDDFFDTESAKTKMEDSAKEHLIQLEVDQYNLICNAIILNSIKK